MNESRQHPFFRIYAVPQEVYSLSFFDLILCYTINYVESRTILFTAAERNKPYTEMRNFFFLLLTLSIFTFAACGDDDAAMAELNQDNIVGDWNLTVFGNDADITIAGATSSVTSDISNSTVVITFAEAGTWTSTGSFDVTIVADSTTTEMYTDGIGSGTYTVTSTQLTMTGIDAGDEADTETPTVLNVQSFSENMMLSLAGSASETVEFFGITATTEVDTEMVLER